jgi:hypothetical protein
MPESNGILLEKCCQMILYRFPPVLIFVSSHLIDQKRLSPLHICIPTFMGNLARSFIVNASYYSFLQIL